METQPSAKPKPKAFQAFEALTRRVMSVPKAEIDRRAVAEKKRKESAKPIKQ